MSTKTSYTRDYLNGVNTMLRVDENEVLIHTEDDFRRVKRLMQHNKEMAERSQKHRTGRIAASVPAAISLQWNREFEKYKKKMSYTDFMRRKLNDSTYSGFRVWRGKV